MTEKSSLTTEPTSLDLSPFTKLDQGINKKPKRGSHHKNWMAKQ